MLRGNDGQPIFFSDGDRYQMCLLMQEGIERFGHSIFSYCFMTNHVHFAIKVNDTSLSSIIQNLAFRYTRYINKKQGRIGHLFQGRFKSILVDKNRYLNELIRYIHLNPVRANLVNLPENYPWSTHRAYLSLDKYAWLNCDEILKNFGSTQIEAAKNYQEFILEGIRSELEIDFKSGFSQGILGDQHFIQQFLNIPIKPKYQEVKLPELVSKICNHYALSISNLRNPTKNRQESYVCAILALFVRKTPNISLRELAIFLECEPSGLSKLANRLEKKCLNHPSLKSDLIKLRSTLIS